MAGVGVSGAGVYAANRIANDVGAFIRGDGSTGIEVIERGAGEVLAKLAVHDAAFHFISKKP